MSTICPARELAGRAVLFEVREKQKHGRESYRLKTRGFLNRFSTECHLNSIGWSDSPIFRNSVPRIRVTPSHRCSDSLSVELPGNTGDYEEYKICRESGSWYSRRGIRATD